MQPGGQLVQIGVAGHHAGVRVFLFGAGVDALVSLVHGIDERNRVADDALLGDVENLAFGRFEHLVGWRDVIVSVAEHFVAGVDQAADDGLVADDARVVLGVGGGGSGVPQLGEIGWAADILDVLLGGEPFGDDDQIDGMTAVVKRPNALEDLLVG